VNRFVEGGPPPAIPAPDYSALAAAQVQRLRQERQKRPERPWRQSLAALQNRARGSEPLMPLIIEAVRARATVGEISDALRAVWGVFRPK
jgi:methylmalonyl-CoA mutase N-terminal domain/subunit